jgi:2'-5' RNA ligase
MVALIPDADTVNRLALEDGLAPDDLHLTLVYLGEADRLGPTDRQAITSSAEALQRRGAIEGQAFGAALFNPQGDEPAAVLVLEAPDVRTLRDELMPQINHLVPDDAHDFVPHVTLTYPSDQMAALQSAIERTGDIRFDRLRVAFGNEITDFPLDTEDLSLVAAAFPVDPPDEWFQDPGLTGPLPFTVDDSGRVYGHLATWGTCHTGVAGTCRTPPHESEFAYFQLGEVVAKSGARIPVGQVTMGTGHAPATLKQMAAAGHYDDTGYVVADVVAGNDKFGIWVAGAARPDLSEIQLRQLRAAKLSGDWRKFGTKLRLVAALAVNVPGFPIPRTTAGMHHGEQVALVASGVVVDGEEPPIGARNYGLLAERIAASIGRDVKSQVTSLAARLGRE